VFMMRDLTAQHNSGHGSLFRSATSVESSGAPPSRRRERIHTETATFELRASEVASPRPGDQLTVGGDTFVIQGEPERRDPDRLVWIVDLRPT
jgi:hypothetical protein